MRSPEQRALAVKVNEVLEAQGNADIIPPAITRDVRRLYPDECLAVGNEAVDQFITDMVQRRLKPSNNAPRLPGFDLPAHLPIEIEGGTVWRATVRCTRDELQAYNKLLLDGWHADRDAQIAFQTEMRRVIRLLDHHGVNRLEDIP
jgi:hypothetical protein